MWCGGDIPATGSRSGDIPHEWHCQVPPPSVLQSCARVGCFLGMRGRREWRAAGASGSGTFALLRGGPRWALLPGSLVRGVSPLLGCVNLESDASSDLPPAVKRPVCAATLNALVETSAGGLDHERLSDEHLTLRELAALSDVDSADDEHVTLYDLAELPAERYSCALPPPTLGAHASGASTCTATSPHVPATLNAPSSTLHRVDEWEWAVPGEDEEAEMVSEARAAGWMGEDAHPQDDDIDICLFQQHEDLEFDVHASSQAVTAEYVAQAVATSRQTEVAERRRILVAPSPDARDNACSTTHPVPPAADGTGITRPVVANMTIAHDTRPIVATALPTVAASVVPYDSPLTEGLLVQNGSSQAMRVGSALSTLAAVSPSPRHVADATPRLVDASPAPSDAAATAWAIADAVEPIPRDSPTLASSIAADVVPPPPPYPEQVSTWHRWQSPPPLRNLHVHRTASGSPYGQTSSPPPTCRVHTVLECCQLVQWRPSAPASHGCSVCSTAL